MGADMRNPLWTKVSLYADLFKHTEYGLDNPAKNHKGELYDTYQYVTA